MDDLPEDISLDKDGHPLCQAGFQISWGYDKNKDRKFLWPVAGSKNVHVLSSVQKVPMGVPSIYRMTLTCGFIPEPPGAVSSINLYIKKGLPAKGLITGS